MILVKNNTWIISDTHFGHDKIVEYSDRPRTHDLIMLSNWISYVGEYDKILHLGDVWWGNENRWAAVLSRLPGKKYLILGNHDVERKRNRSLLTLRSVFTIIEEFELDGYYFSHRPYTQDGDWHTNIHGHTHTNEWTVEHDGIPVEGKRYVNACVEHTAYAPIQFGTLIQRGL